MNRHFPVESSPALNIIYVFMLWKKKSSTILFTCFNDLSGGKDSKCLIYSYFRLTENTALQGSLKIYDVQFILSLKWLKILVFPLNTFLCKYICSNLYVFSIIFTDFAAWACTIQNQICMITWKTRLKIACGCLNYCQGNNNRMLIKSLFTRSICFSVLPMLQ